MNKFIIGTFLLLGFGFYQLSGGANFQPEQIDAAERAAVAVAPETVPFDEPQVTRAAAFEMPTEIPVEDAVIIEASVEVPNVQEVTLDLRVVSGNRVNMRTGPGTNYGVLDKLVRGAQAEVIEVANGWARIRVVETGQIGWMATSLLDPT